MNQWIIYALAIIGVLLAVKLLKGVIKLAIIVMIVIIAYSLLKIEGIV